MCSAVLYFPFRLPSLKLNSSHTALPSVKSTTLSNPKYSLARARKARKAVFLDNYFLSLFNSLFRVYKAKLWYMKLCNYSLQRPWWIYRVWRFRVTRESEMSEIFNYSLWQSYPETAPCDRPVHPPTILHRPAVCSRLCRPLSDSIHRPAGPHSWTPPQPPLEETEEESRAALKNKTKGGVMLWYISSEGCHLKLNWQTIVLSLLEK